jgi:hypothetical protein
LTLNNLRDGRHTVEVEAADEFGHTERAAHAWTVDATAPRVTFDGTDGQRISATRTVVSWKADEAATFMCSVDGDPFEACHDGRLTVARLVDGPHSLRVKASDGLQESAPVTRTWTVDTKSPQVTLTGEDGTFAFSADEAATFSCRLDNGAFTPCTDRVSYPGLSAGAHTFTLRAMDGLNPATEVVRAFAIAAPKAPEPTPAAAQAPASTPAAAQAPESTPAALVSAPALAPAAPVSAPAPAHAAAPRALGVRLVKPSKVIVTGVPAGATVKVAVGRSVRAVVSRTGGTVTVKAALNRGARVTVRVGAATVRRTVR